MFTCNEEGCVRESERGKYSRNIEDGGSKTGGVGRA